MPAGLDAYFCGLAVDLQGRFALNLGLKFRKRSEISFFIQYLLPKLSGRE